MRTQQNNRPFDSARLAARRTYKGGSYTLPSGASGFHELERTGAEWRTLLSGLRVEHNGDCVAAYSGHELRYEVYDR